MQIPRLHPDTVEEVKQRADIVDVISEHVVLKKRGKDYVGLCPFHDEKSPSFTVSPAKQMYYCFGCQAGGNVIKFLMERGKRPFAEVVLDLARRYQVPVQTLEPEQRQELQRQLSIREQLYEILAVAAQFYVHALHQPSPSPHPPIPPLGKGGTGGVWGAGGTGQQALEYLKSERQLKEETIQQFQLGYAPASWETLYRYLVEQKRYSVQLVEQAGLIVPRKSGGGHYDQFRDRLMIPIHDTQGRVIGFGARSLGDEQPKYLNSPETELFNKGKTLFALDKARAAIAKQDRAVVVEGYFDAIALHQAGISNVVASLGTALSLDQVRILLRHTESKQIVLNFDADPAGTKAAFRAIGEIANLAYRGEVQLQILNLPDGKDADEFLRKGDSEKYQELLNTAPLWIDWQMQQILVGKDLKQANQYQQAAQEIVKLLGNITNDNQLTHYINKCAELLCQGDSRRIPLLRENLLTQIVRHWQELLSQDNSLQVPLLVSNIFKQSKRPLLPRAVTRDKRTQQALPVSEGSDLAASEALLLRFYIHCPEYRQAIIEALEERDLLFSLPQHRFLWLKILDIQTQDNIPAAALISKLQDLSTEFPKDMEQVSYLFHVDEKTERDILRAPQLIKHAAASMERVMCENIKRHYRELWQKTDISTDAEKLQYYWQELENATQRIKELDRELEFLYFYRY